MMHAHSATAWTLGIAFVAGLGLGAFFYGGLWWTVNRLETVRNPGLLFAASFLSRTVITLAGFWLVSGGQWQAVATCLIGFLVMRFLLTRRWGPGRGESIEVEASEHAA